MSLSVSAPEILKTPMSIPEKTLLGPGPSNVPDRVLKAMALPTIGHLHPEFTKVMDDVKAGIQYIFQTKNKMTLALSSTGHAGMECVMTNLIEKNDVVLIANHGIWGERAMDMARRQGGDVRELAKPAGEVFTLEEVGRALETHKPVLFFVTHAESSTGGLQGLEGIGPLCASHDCLFVVDTVASLCGVPLRADDLGIDGIYTGSQKVLGVPPGLAPISFSDKAVAKIMKRASPPTSFCLDMNWLGKYWNCFEGQGRVYHHTGPINLIYGLREGLAMIAEEGLEKCWDRHRSVAQKLYQGLEAMGLELFVSVPSSRTPTVTTVKVPEGVDWKAVTVYAMEKYKLEIAGGLGPTAGRVWRIGLMGQNAKPEKVEMALKVLKEALDHVKAKV